jgi:hypothetical protein
MLGRYFSLRPFLFRLTNYAEAPISDVSACQPINAAKEDNVWGSLTPKIHGMLGRIELAASRELSGAAQPGTRPKGRSVPEASQLGPRLKPAQHGTEQNRDDA